jgi:hypothetical protein
VLTGLRQANGSLADSAATSAQMQSAIGNGVYVAAQQSFITASALSNTYNVVSMTTTSGQVQASPPGAMNNIGIAQTVGGDTQLYVQSYGESEVRFDGTPVVGDFACAPPTGTGTAGLAHDNGTTPCPVGQKLGVVTQQVSGSGSGATATVLLQLGS